MRKHLLLIFLLAIGGVQLATRADNCNGCAPCKTLAAPCEPCGCKSTSHTFFSIRPLYQIASPEHETLFRGRVHARDEDSCVGGALQIVPFGSRSLNNARLATFFAPTCKTVLLVSGQPADNPDIIANYFNIRTVSGTFKSQISFAPRHTETGLGISYKQAFDVSWCGCEKTLWFEISGPITHVRNTLGFCENVIDDGGGAASDCGDPFVTNDDDVINQPVANMTEAFKQTQWHYGRINNNCSLSKTRLANLDLLFGWEVTNTDCCHLDSYVGVSLPTGNRIRSVNLFEPVVGLNHHVGIMFGSNAGMQVWEECDRNLWFELSLLGNYMLSNCQRRLLDLKNKPWSRFMRVYKNKAQAETAEALDDPCLHTPGVDVFAINLKVTPGFQRTINTAIVYNSCGFQGELGYNFYAREAECVSFKKPWEEGPALVSPRDPGYTDRVQQINDQFGFENAKSAEDYNLNIIKQCDFDLDSAAMPSTITHTLYGSAGWMFDSCCVPMLAGIGGSYEFSHDNNGMDRFVIWGKFGVSF